MHVRGVAGETAAANRAATAFVYERTWIGEICALHCDILRKVGIEEAMREPRAAATAGIVVLGPISQALAPPLGGTGTTWIDRSAVGCRHKPRRPVEAAPPPHKAVV